MGHYDCKECGGYCCTDPKCGEAEFPHIIEAKAPKQEKPVTTSLNDTLAERKGRYGDFEHHAKIADDLNKVMSSTPGWDRLAPDMRESLRIINNKIGRILNGDPEYSDSWHDIVGYAALVDNRLKAGGK